MRKGILFFLVLAVMVTVTLANPAANPGASAAFGSTVGAVAGYFNGQPASRSVQVLTRAQFASMLVKTMGLPPAQKTYVFGDVPANAYYRGDLATLKEHGIMVGYPDGSMHPNDPLTLRAALAMVGHGLGLDGDAPLPDLTSGAHWGQNAYAWLMKLGLVDEAKNLDVVLSPAAGQQILDHVFGDDAQAKAIVDRANATSKDLQSFSAQGSMDIKIVARPGNNLDVPDIPAIHGDMALAVQKPDRIHATVTVAMPTLPDEAEATAVPPLKVEEYYIGSDFYICAPNPDPAAGGRGQWLKMPAGSMPDLSELMNGEGNPLGNGDLANLADYRYMDSTLVNGRTIEHLSFYAHVDDPARYYKDVFGGLSGLTDILNQSTGLLKDMFLGGTMDVDAATGLTQAVDFTGIVKFGDTWQGQAIPMSQELVHYRLNYDYSQPVNIVLPDAAKEAQEMPLPPVPAPPANI